ncbi:MAG: YhcB family protein [Bacteroidales bacterium]|nr:YhcB family protein [Bacteroidales bacterium]
MNEKIKFTAIILGTLIIGFVIGFLTNGRLVKSRIDRMQSFYTEKGANRAFVHVLEPTPAQMEKIRPILQEHAVENRDLLFTYREDQEALFLHLEDELRPYLTDEQMEKLEELKHRWQGRFQGKGMMRGRGGPGHRGGRPGGGGPPFLE